MGSKTRLRSYCTKRGDNTVNLVTSRKTIMRLAHPICLEMSRDPPKSQSTTPPCTRREVSVWQGKSDNGSQS